MFLKLSSVMTVALTLLASSCCYSFVDRHHPPAVVDDVAVDYRQQLNGMLQHIWYVEHMRSEQARLAILRVQRKALESVIQQRECGVAPVLPVTDRCQRVEQLAAVSLLNPRVSLIFGVHQ